MERIVNTGVGPLAAQRQPEAANANAARQGGGEPRGAPRETVRPAPEAAGSATIERLRPAAASRDPVVDAAGAAAILARVHEQFSRLPDEALRAHASPGAGTVLQLLDG